MFVKGVIIVQSQSKVQRIEHRAASSLSSLSSLEISRGTVHAHIAPFHLCVHTHRSASSVYTHVAGGLVIDLFTLTQTARAASSKPRLRTLNNYISKTVSLGFLEFRYNTTNVVINNTSVFFSNCKVTFRVIDRNVHFFVSVS